MNNSTHFFISSQVFNIYIIFYKSNHINTIWIQPNFYLKRGIEKNCNVNNFYQTFTQNYSLPNHCKNISY